MLYSVDVDFEVEATNAYAAEDAVIAVLDSSLDDFQYRINEVKEVSIDD